MGTATAAPTTTRGASAAAAKSNLGFNRKAHVRKVDGNSFYFCKQFLLNAKLVGSLVEYGISVVGLIQSQHQAWAASATSRKVYANGAYLFAFKVGVQLLLGLFSQGYHVKPPKLVTARANHYVLPWWMRKAPARCIGIPPLQAYAER